MNSPYQRQIERLQSLSQSGLDRRYTPDAEVRAIREEDAAPQLLGRAITFDSMSRTLYGAFKEVISNDVEIARGESDVRALYEHDTTRILGREENNTLTLERRSDGLWATVTPPDTQYAREAVTLVEGGYLRGMSFGFKPVKWDEARSDDDGTPVMVVREMELREVSWVSNPAYLLSSASVKRSLDSYVAMQKNHEKEAEKEAALKRAVDEAMRVEVALLELEIDMMDNT